MEKSHFRWTNFRGAGQGHVLEVVGTLGSFQDRLQITIERLRIVPEVEIKFADFPPGTTGKPDEYVSDTAPDSFQHGEWLSTDASAQMAMMAHVKAEQLEQKYMQGSTFRQELKPVEKSVQKPYDSAEIRRRLTQSHDKSEELRRKYGPHPTKKEDF